MMKTMTRLLHRIWIKLEKRIELRERLVPKLDFTCILLGGECFKLDG